MRIQTFLDFANEYADYLDSIPNLYTMTFTQKFHVISKSDKLSELVKTVPKDMTEIELQAFDYAMSRLESHVF